MPNRQAEIERVTGYSLPHVYRIAKARGCSLKRMSINEIAAMVREHVAGKELRPRDPQRIQVGTPQRSGERPGRVLSANDRRLRYFEHGGERRTRSAWAALCGVPLSTMRWRMRSLGVAVALARSLEHPGKWPPRFATKTAANDNAQRGAA